jgi:chromosome segregation ATPase
MTNERVITDINLQESLSQMAESTTAAELVRTQGQTKKVKVLSERKLMEWISALLNQHLAAKEDTFSDLEKGEVLRKVQDELAKRIQREQAAERERARIQAELEQVMAQISRSSGDQSGLEAALANLRAQLTEAERARTELEQDTYDLQDQLQEKLNLLSTTIAEKDKLRDALRVQMLRANTLVEAVLGMDSSYYANRHSEDNPVAEDTPDDERFFHDYDVGVLILKTLRQDLETLRSITDKLGAQGSDQRSLAQDIELLTEVKSGSLHALDVAAPVSGLIEALAGAQAEAEALDSVVCAATGSQPRPLSALPDPDGDPGVVLAGATTIARELAAEFARDRQRVTALVSLADEADAARNQMEEELAQARAEQTIALTANAEVKDIAQAVITAAQNDPVLADGAAELALGLDPESTPEPDYAAQVAKTISELGQRKTSLETELAAALAAQTVVQSQLTGVQTEQHNLIQQQATLEAQLAAALAQVTAARVQAEQAEAEAQAAKGAAADVAARLQELEQRHAERIRTDKILAGELLQATKQDDLLADVTTDLSVALDDGFEPSELQQQLTRTVSALAQRQQTLSAENSTLSQHSERLRAEVGEAKRSLAETQHTVARAVIEAGKDDADLTDSVQQLEWALEQMRPGEPMPSDLLATLNQALSRLAARKQEVQAERDELALNSKEIISALTASRDQREGELKAIRQDQEETADRLAMLESRAATAEAANRDLAEALSQAAVDLDSAEGEEARVDLELALSQLPGPGEEGIDVPADITTHLAAHGTRLAQALATVRQQAAAEQARLTQELAQARTELDHQQESLLAKNDAIALSQAETEGHRARIVNLERQLALSQAEIAGFTAHGGASTDGLRSEVTSLRDALAQEQDQAKARDLAMAEIRENMEQAESRHQHLREELTRRLAERDQLIRQKDSELDAVAENRSQVAGLEAQVETLQHELHQATHRIAELSTASGTHASITGKHTNIGNELKRTQADRDSLRAQQLALEGELAEANSKIHVLQSREDEKRKELLTIREQIQHALDAERRKNASLSDEVGQLKADKVGLEHKLRKLTGDG